MTRLVIVGGGAAGMSVASVVRRRDPSIDVVLLEAGQHISFSACGMPYWIGGRIEGDADELVIVDPAEARDDRGIDVRLGTRAVGVDPDAREVEIDGIDTGRLGYDKLCIATGAKAVDPFGGVELGGVHTLRHLDDGVALDTELDASEPERACIVGGGFVGLEMAEALLARGLEVDLVHSHPTVLSGMVDDALGEVLNERLEDSGVELHMGQRATGLTGNGDVEAVQTEGVEIGTDLVIVAIGARPDTRLAEDAGCRLDASGAIAVDGGMRTSVNGIFACGDCVAFQHRLTGETVFLPLALHANRSGRIAGENIAGGEERFPGVLGTAVTTFEELEVARTGLSQAQAAKAGIEAVSRTIESVTRAGYFPGADPVRTRLVVEVGTGRLLGGQIVGGPGSGKRIDTVAAATWMGASAQELEAMDLAYAPPVSPTWDPVAIAARLAGREAL